MQNLDLLIFDPIHDAQHMFREVLESMARPGRVRSIASSAEKLSNAIELGNQAQGFERVAMAFALTVLDAEVSFLHMTSEAEGLHALGWSKSIVRTTFAKLQPLEKADFLFAWHHDVVCCGPQVQTWIEQIDAKARRGTLTRPDHSATIFLGISDVQEQVDGVYEQELYTSLMLKGPGVDGVKHLYLRGLNLEWLRARKEWNHEFPKGMDWVLFTADGRFFSLPRTTSVHWEE